MVGVSVMVRVSNLMCYYNLESEQGQGKFMVIFRVRYKNTVMVGVVVQP